MSRVSMHRRDVLGSCRVYPSEYTAYAERQPHNTCGTYVCVYVCTYVYVYVCVCMYVYVCMCVCMWLAHRVIYKV